MCICCHRHHCRRRRRLHYCYSLTLVSRPCICVCASITIFMFIASKTSNRTKKKLRYRNTKRPLLYFHKQNREKLKIKQQQQQCERRTMKNNRQICHRSGLAWDSDCTDGWEYVSDDGYAMTIDALLILYMATKDIPLNILTLIDFNTLFYIIGCHHISTCHSAFHDILSPAKDNVEHYNSI